MYPFIVFASYSLVVPVYGWFSLYCYSNKYICETVLTIVILHFVFHFIFNKSLCPVVLKPTSNNCIYYCCSLFVVRYTLPIHSLELEHSWSSNCYRICIIKVIQVSVVASRYHNILINIIMN